MFEEMVSKDTIKKVAGAWYGFTKPFSAEAERIGPKKRKVY